MSRNLSGNLVICQSGGPTAVFNSSLAGMIEEALRHNEIRGVYGAINGILGVLKHDMIDLKREVPSVIAGLRSTPTSALGSSRHKLKDEEIEAVLNIFKRYDIRYFMVNGGNGSMYVGKRVFEIASEMKYSLRVMGIPKTVDNDLPYTDHCPGYGSIGRWLAIATMDSGKDTEAIHTADPIKIIETMGRNTGWVVATTALAKQYESAAPHLIYFPEIPLIMERFLKDVQKTYDSLGYAVIAVCEGAKGADGKTLVESKQALDTDSFGHRQLGGVGQYLADTIASNLKIKARCDKPGTIQRSSMLLASETDCQEAFLVGRKAVSPVLTGKFCCTSLRSLPPKGGLARMRSYWSAGWMS